MGELALGLTLGIGGGAAVAVGVVAFVAYQWGRADERANWFKLIAEDQHEAQEAGSAAPPDDPLAK